MREKKENPRLLQAWCQHPQHTRFSNLACVHASALCVRARGFISSSHSTCTSCTHAQRRGEYCKHTAACSACILCVVRACKRVLFLAATLLCLRRSAKLILILYSFIERQSRVAAIRQSIIAAALLCQSIIAAALLCQSIIAAALLCQSIIAAALLCKSIIAAALLCLCLCLSTLSRQSRVAARDRVAARQSRQSRAAARNCILCVVRACKRVYF
jgi:hypothetical protein